MRTLGALTAALVLLPLGAVHAAAPHTSRLEVHGKAGPAKGLYGFDVSISASKQVGKPAAGSFSSAFAPEAHGVASPGLLTLQGPVTCLDIVGNKAGLLYPLQRVTTAAGTTSGEPMSILISVTGGAKPMMGFAGPLPTAAFSGKCAPSLTSFVVDGTVRVTP